MLLYNCKGKRKEKEPQRKEVKKMRRAEEVRRIYHNLDGEFTDVIDWMIIRRRMEKKVTKAHK